MRKNPRCGSCSIQIKSLSFLFKSVPTTLKKISECLLIYVKHKPQAEVMLFWKLMNLQACLSFLFCLFAPRNHLDLWLWQFRSKIICTIKTEKEKNYESGLDCCFIRVWPVFFTKCSISLFCWEGDNKINTTLITYLCNKCIRVELERKNLAWQKHWK